MTINVLRGNEVEFQPVHWLWRPYIPYGMLTTLVGDPGAGKTWLACKLAANLSRGEALPGHFKPYPPQKILFASADDSVVHTLGPRMKDLGADLSNVYFIEDKVTLDTRGLREFGEVVRDFAATFVVLDPIVGFFSGEKDMNSGVDVRQVMGGLKIVAEHTGSAIVAIRHKRKASADGKGPSIYAGSGSIDFVGAARSELHVARRQSGVAVMSHEKTNIGPTGRPLAYTFGSEDGERGIEHHHFEWISTADTELFGSSAGSEAANFIKDLLKSGPVPAKVVLDRAEEAGIAIRTLKSAKSGLAKSRKLGDGTWEWVLL